MHGMSSHCTVQLWRRKARDHSAKLRPSSCRLGIAASSRHHKWHTVSNLLDTLSAYRGRASQNFTVQHLNWKVLPGAAPWSTLVDRCRPCRGLHEGVCVRSAWLACHRERRAAPISTFSEKGYSSQRPGELAHICSAGGLGQLKRSELELDALTPFSRLFLYRTYRGASAPGTGRYSVLS